MEKGYSWDRRNTTNNNKNQWLICNNENCQVKGTPTPQSLDMETEVLYWKCKSCPKKYTTRRSTRSTQSLPSFSTPKNEGRMKHCPSDQSLSSYRKKLNWCSWVTFERKVCVPVKASLLPVACTEAPGRHIKLAIVGSLVWPAQGVVYESFIGVVCFSMLSLLIFKQCIAIKRLYSSPLRKENHDGIR